MQRRFLRSTRNWGQGVRLPSPIFQTRLRPSSNLSGAQIVARLMHGCAALVRSLPKHRRGRHIFTARAVAPLAIPVRCKPITGSMRWAHHKSGRARRNGLRNTPAMRPWPCDGPCGGSVCLPHAVTAQCRGDRAMGGHAGAHQDLAQFLRDHAEPKAGLGRFQRAILPDLPNTKPDWVVMEDPAQVAEIAAAAPKRAAQ